MVTHLFFKFPFKSLDTQERLLALPADVVMIIYIRKPKMRIERISPIRRM
jgi:hypothetical protein